MQYDIKQDCMKITPAAHANQVIYTLSNFNTDALPIFEPGLISMVNISPREVGSNPSFKVSFMNYTTFRNLFLTFHCIFTITYVFLMHLNIFTSYSLIFSVFIPVKNHLYHHQKNLSHLRQYYLFFQMRDQFVPNSFLFPAPVQCIPSTVLLTVPAEKDNRIPDIS